MMFNTKSEKNYKEKKYLLVVVILIIISAIGLSIANSLGNKSLANLDDNKEGLNLELEAEVGEGNYLALKTPTLKSDDLVLGNKNAELKLFVFEDYDDGFSSKLASDLERLVIERGDKISIVLRPFIGFSPNSKDNALALYCARNDNKWQALRKEFLGLNKREESEVLNGDLAGTLDGKLDENSISEKAELVFVLEKVGLEAEKISECLTEAEKSGKIEEIKKEALDYQVFGSPTLFIGNEMVLGARPYESYIGLDGEEIEGLKALVDRALSAK